MNYNDEAKTCAVAPQETIYNMLKELKDNAFENRKLSYGIREKLYNTILMNGEKNGCEKPETVESLLDEIRSIVRESNNTLYGINDRL